jgi:signal peptidase I
MSTNPEQKPTPSEPSPLGLHSSNSTFSVDPIETVAPTPHRSASKQRYVNLWLEVAQVVTASVVLALGIRHFAAEARYIPSESMVPTLEVDDRLIIEKLSYHFHTPQRGDIIVFQPPDRLKQRDPELKDALIKRVIGLPGETIAIRGGRVFVNDQPLREAYIAAQPDYEWGPEIVPADSYLVLGDNRNNSNDSHVWGYVPRDHVIGRAIFRFWPPDRLGGINPEPLYSPAR